MDILDEMTKPELIAWIKEEVFFRRPNGSWLAFHRWKVASAKLEDEEIECHAALKKIDLKKHDEYAKKFNASTDLKEKERLLLLIKPISDELEAWLKKNKELDAKRVKVDAIYEQIEIERNKEAKDNAHPAN